MMRRSPHLISLIFAILIVCNSMTIAEIIVHKVSFDKNDLVFKKVNGYDFITLKRLDVSFDVGDPQLPIQIVIIIIPDGEKVERIEIMDSKSQVLDGFYDILPVQNPEVLSSARNSNKMISLTRPNPTVYSSEQDYPSRVIEVSGVRSIGSARLASVRIFPLQYLPLKRKIRFFSEITFQITTAPDVSRLPRRSPISTAQSDALKSMVEKLALNFEKGNEYIRSTSTGTEEYQYLIITSETLVKNFQPLADWKHKKGVPSKIVTLEWIYSNYEGIDKQEKIRNFIRSAYTNWGAVWVLLGGDTNILPRRSVFAMDCEFGGSITENDIPCDLYYADLDGSWNADGDNIYGEISDDVNLYPEVFIGRAPVENASETDIFVKKVLQYEKTPPIGYQKNMLFAAELLWIDPYTDTGIAKDMIEAECFPPSFYNVTKLYEDRGNETIEAVRSAINLGQNFINHHGHASTNVMGMGNGYFRASDMQNLVNGTNQSILFSIGCYPANFEANCIAEAFLSNPNGGGVAFIGNSRYGWGSPGNPGYGYSDRYDAQFFKFLFKEKVYNIGKALALAKAYYAPFSQQQNVYRWCMYEINLLGDPEMPAWTDVPETLTVNYPLQVVSPGGVVPVTVTLSDAPVENALVCLMQESGNYYYGRTDNGGQISISISNVNVAKNLLLTVTAPNCLPSEKVIAVTSETAYIYCSRQTIDDSRGNGDGFINPGESVPLKLRFKNFGNQPAKAIHATITCSDSSIFITDGDVFVGDLAGGDSVECTDTFNIDVSSNSKNQDIFHLKLKVEDNIGNTWDQVISLSCATPVLSVASYRISDVKSGNGNGIPEPGEQVVLYTGIRNKGITTANSVQASLTISDQNLIIEPKIGSFGDILPQTTATDSFIISVPTSYSNFPSFPDLLINAVTGDGYKFALRFNLSIGATGFMDDTENGEGNWHIVNPATNSWHISSRSRHSGSYAWYCGESSTGNYVKNSESILESPAFYLGQRAQLTFWAWYNVAIYGVNGFYVQIFDGTEWHKLDFIGSGGALDSTLMGNDWLQYSYDLSTFQPGTLAKIRFHCVSDNEPLPQGKMSGVFIDDVTVTSQLVLPEAETMDSPLPVPSSYRLAQNYPNPFNSYTTIEYEISGITFQNVELGIYNLLGQKVKMLIERVNGPGYYTIFWDGRDDVGSQVASGVYIYQLSVSGMRLEKKLIVLR
jgi:hypothetical protein